MIWHIFKKDARLLWPFVLGAAGIQFTSEGLRYAMDHYEVGEGLSNLSNLLKIATLLVSGFLVATVVHQDPIPGVRQDWLVRPVRRGDLLVAKLLFVLLMVQAPILLADMMQGLANGFPITQSLAAATSRGLYLLFGLNVPVLAFASLTRNMGEAVIGAVVSFLGFAVLQILVNNRGQLGTLRGTGLFWIAESTMLTVALAGSSALLAIQYFRRKTLLARWGVAAVAFLFFLAYIVPWRLAFAVQQRLSPHPGAGSAITAKFDQSASKFRLPHGRSRNTVIMERSGVSVTRDEASTVYLPLRIVGLPDDAVLNTDNTQTLLTTSNGSLLHRGHADDLLVRTDGHLEPIHFNIGSRRGLWEEIGSQDMAVPKDRVPNNGEVLVYQGLSFPRSLYESIKDQPLHLEINYSWTLLQGSTYTIPALGGDVRMPGVGHCKTRMDDDGDDIQLRCIQAGGMPNCGSAFLEHAPSGRRNPMKFSCWPNYSPYSGHYAPDAMVRFGGALRFRDLSGLAKYPVDAAQIPESRVVLRVYQPQDHFTRRLVIPSIHLSEWAALSNE